MKKYSGIAILILSLVAMGAISAYGLSKMDMKGPHSDVVAGVISTSGDNVRLYYNGQEGNKAFCKGENIPIFKQYGLAATERLTGEVKITKLIGHDQAEGRLIVGDAKSGDVATKPTAMCLKG